MYNQPRPLDTTIVGVRAAGIKYYLDFSNDISIKKIVFKSDLYWKTLEKEGSSWVIKLSPEELENVPNQFPYTLMIYMKNQIQEITGKVIIKR